MTSPDQPHVAVSMTDARGRLTLGQPRSAYYTLPLGGGQLLLIPVPHLTAPAQAPLSVLAENARKTLLRLETSALLGTDTAGALVTVDPLQGLLIVGRYHREIFDLLYGRLVELYPDTKRFFTRDALRDWDEATEGAQVEWEEAHGGADPWEDNVPPPPGQQPTVLVGGNATATLDPSDVDPDTVPAVAEGTLSRQHVEFFVTQSRLQLVPRALHCSAHFMVADHASDDVLSAAKWAVARTIGEDDFYPVTVIEATRSDGVILTDRDHPDGTFVRRVMAPVAGYTPIYPITGEDGQ